MIASNGRTIPSFRIALAIKRRLEAISPVREFIISFGLQLTPTFYQRATTTAITRATTCEKVRNLDFLKVCYHSSSTS
jgi:hypothetical protein